MLNFDISFIEAARPVTVLKMSGELDAASYESAIDKTADLYADGTRDLLLDLGDLTFMSSTGIVALHSMAMIMRGQKLPEEDAGWGKFTAIARDVEASSGPEAHLKLLSPQARIRKTLDISGFSQILEIFEDQNAALAAF